jgi:hypothetical protein
MAKKPKRKENPTVKKQPYERNHPPDSSSQGPAWKFALFDPEGPFGDGHDKLAKSNVIDDILPSLRNFESMSWIEIMQAGSHSISCDKLCKEAKDRLEARSLDDNDEVFSLRLSGKKRIFGIRQNQYLQILWWDPEHEVCPAQLKHT